MPPLWVIVCRALAMAAGTYFGGRRVIRTLGKGLVDIESSQGMAAESSSAAIILLSSHFGYSLSTTQVVTGSVMGSGLGRPGAEVRWAVARRMATAWLITLPMAGAIGAVTYRLIHTIGGYPGTLVGLALLVGISTLIWLQSRKVPISQDNVTADRGDNMTDGLNPAAPQSIIPSTSESVAAEEVGA